MVISSKKLSPHPLLFVSNSAKSNIYSQPLLPLREIEMMKAMENLTENEQWHVKVS